MRRAIFLDRDGVLIEDVHLLQDAAAIRVLAGVPQALARARDANFLLPVVSNQAVVARGLLTYEQMQDLHAAVVRALAAAGAPLDAFYACPHHPNATLPAYRSACDCRKPRPGLLLRAAREHQVDLHASFMVGDRPTDIAAGARAGCRTVLVRSGAHSAPPIESPDGPVGPVRPDFCCAGLAEAVDWILEAG